MNIIKPYVIKKLLVLVMLFALTITSCAQKQHQEEVQGISPFVNGFARVEIADHNFYIDSTGQYAFDYMYPVLQHNFEFGNRYAIEQYQWEVKYDKNVLPKTIFSVYREKDNQWGIITPDGNWLLKPEYTHNDEAILKYTRKLNEKSNPPASLSKFDKFGILDGVHFDVKKDEKWGVYNAETDKMVIPFDYDKFDYCGGCPNKPDYVIAQKNEKWGVVSLKNEVLVPFEYEHSHWGMRSDVWVQSFKKNGKNLIVHIPTKKDYFYVNYQDIGILNYSILQLKQNGKAGLIGPDGNVLLPFEYDDFSIPITKKGSYGLYSATDYYGPYLTAVKNGKAGLIDKNAQVILPYEYDVHEWQTFSIHDSYIIARKNGKKTLLNDKGEILLPAEFDEIEPSYEKDQNGNSLLLFVYQKNDLLGIYNTAKRTKIPPIYDDISVYDKMSYHNDKLHNNGVIEVVQGNKTGWINFSGNTLIPNQYNSIKPINVYASEPQTLFIVETNGKKGLYDLELKKERIAPAYTSIDFFSKEEFPNLLQVELNKKYGLFDIALGKEILAPDFGFLYPPEKDKWIYTRDSNYEKTGIVDTKGNIILEQKYDEVTLLSSNIFLLNTGNNYQLFNHKTQHNKTIDFPVVWASGDENALFVSNDSTTVQIFNIPNNTLLPEIYSANKLNLYIKENLTLPAIYRFEHGVARVEKIENNLYGKIGFINPQGSYVVPVEYDIASFSAINRMLMLGKAHNEFDDYGNAFHYGFADNSGKMIIPISYDYDKSVSNYITNNHLAIVKQDLKTNSMRTNYKMGMADYSGKVILKPEYDIVLSVNKGKHFLLLNKSKEKTKNTTYHKSMYATIYDHGLADADGKVLIPVSLEEIYTKFPIYLDDDSIEISFPLPAKQNGKWQYFTEEDKTFRYKAENLIDFIQK